MLVPLNRTYPIQDVMKACHEYVRTEGRGKNARRITFEYVMLRDVNDGLAEAREVARLLKEVPGHVNLMYLELFFPFVVYNCDIVDTFCLCDIKYCA